MSGNIIPVPPDVQLAVPPQPPGNTVNSAKDDGSGFYSVLTSAVKATSKSDSRSKPEGSLSDSENSSVPVDKPANSPMVVSPMVVLPQFAILTGTDPTLAATNVAADLSNNNGVEAVGVLAVNQHFSYLPPDQMPFIRGSLLSANTGKQQETVTGLEMLATENGKLGNNGASISEQQQGNTASQATMRQSAANMIQASNMSGESDELSMLAGGKPTIDKTITAATNMPDMQVLIADIQQNAPVTTADADTTPIGDLNALLGVQVQAAKSPEKLLTNNPAQQRAEQITAATSATPTVGTTISSSVPVAEQSPPAALTPISSANGGEAANLRSAEDSGDLQTAGLDSQTNSTVSFAAALDQQKTTSGPVAGMPDSNQAKTADPYNVTGQIVDQAKLITTPHNSEMVIKLKPEHLGELTLKIVVDSGAVSASFHSSNAEVRAIIENSLTQLRQDFSNQGLKVNYVGVYASLDQFTPKDQRGNNYQQQLVKVKNKRGDGQDFAEAVDAISANGGLYSSANGVDYRI